MKISRRENFIDFLPKINMLLAACIVILTIYLVIDVMRPHRFSVRCQETPKLVSDALSLRFEGMPAFQEGIFKSRALFNALSESKSHLGGQEFELLGLVAVGDKTAAMIRDVHENKDYYCLGGEQIGAFKVKRILKDKVILQSESQTLELYR